MSFGFSVGDFALVLKTAKGIYKACKNGPAEYREICNEAKSMRYAIKNLCDNAEDPGSLMNRKGINRKKELDEIIGHCQSALRELQNVIDKHSSLQDDTQHSRRPIRIWHAFQVASNDLDSLRDKLTFNTSMISMFLLSLEGSAIARIENKINEMYDHMLKDDMARHQQSTASLDSTLSNKSTESLLSQIDNDEDTVWKVLKREILAEGISMAHVMANREDVVQYIRSLIESGKLIETTEEGRDIMIPEQDVNSQSP